MRNLLIVASFFISTLSFANDRVEENQVVAANDCEYIGTSCGTRYKVCGASTTQLIQLAVALDGRDCN